MEFDQIYDEIVSYEKIDQKGKQIECHGTPIEKKKRKCIFCGKSYPDVTFSKVAHAVSETLGNKVLISHYECDKCNLAFGSVLEDSFGKYVAPFKQISQIYGKKTTLTIKDFPKDNSLSYGTFRMESHSNCPAVDENGDIHNYIIEKSGTGILKEIDGGYSLTIPRQKYDPRLVYAALLKMGYGLLPFSEIQNWIYDTLYLGEFTYNFKSNESDQYFSSFPTKGILAFYAGKNPLNGLSVHLYRRKDNLSESYFKYLFQLDFYNFSITVPIIFHTEIRNFSMPSSQYKNATSVDLIDFRKEDVSFTCEFSAQKVEIPKCQYSQIESKLKEQKLLICKESENR